MSDEKGMAWTLLARKIGYHDKQAFQQGVSGRLYRQLT